MAADTFTAVRVEGGLLPADLLERLSWGLAGRAGATGRSGGATDIDGFRAEDYHLAGETLREAATAAWTRLTGTWAAFTDGLERLPAGDTATAHTRERWLLPLFRALDYGWLERATTGRPAGGLPAGGSADATRFPVSHVWRDVPVHLLGWNVPIDRRTPGVAGAASAAPASGVQDLLNRSDGHLWAVVSNGRTLRLLRDSASLVRASYVEFDLEAMFSGELFSEFLLMFALLHQSRFERLSPDGGPADCWAERWRVAALDRGVRALDLLRDGVVAAIDTLGTGFLRHPDNRALRESLRTGGLRAEDYQRCLLRLVYRLLFWFVAEDRDALHPAGADTAADAAARDRYARYFSAGRLRHAAARRFGTVHSDRWHALRLVFAALGGAHGTGGVPALGLPALGGVFESGPLDGPLDGCQVANSDLLAAVRHLSVLPGQRGGPRRRVDYRDLDSEELGSVYESLLEYLPRIDPDSRTFRLAKLSGNERKSTGSYYTPSALIECLLDSALDPVLDDAVKAGNTGAEQEAALLAVTVCDPACGSGHFLVAAARRIAKRLAVVRTGELEPSPADVRHALHDVVGGCVYGVDINPLAVELARVSLWLEALEPGRPLGFLDAHVRVGNSLLGVTPALLAEGLPEEAFKPIEGDDRKIARALAKQNAADRAGQGDLFADAGLHLGNSVFGRQVRQIAAAASDRLDDVHVQRQRYERWRSSPDLARRRQVADAWCAAFVWRKTKDAPTPVTHQTLLDLDADPDQVAWWIREEVDRLAGDYRFFHWHLEFPEIFTVPDDGTSVDERTGWSGGFSCLLGNPPWERVKLQEQEFFAARDERIAKAPNAAARRRLIAALAGSDLESDRALHKAFTEAKRQAEGVSHLLRDTGRFPLTGRGDVNTYAVFAETATLAVHPHGRFGMVLPTGIGTDATTQYFFRSLVDSTTLASFYDFENEAFLLSREVHHSFHFSLLTGTGRATKVERARFAFFIRHLRDLHPRSFEMSPAEILLLNPNTGTCPVFRSRRDAEITLDIYRRVPVLIRQGDPDGNPWGVSFMTMFHMSGDSELFRTRDALERDGWTLHGNVFTRDGDRMLPLYQGMMTNIYDHRAADIRRSETAAKRQNQPSIIGDLEKMNPNRVPIPAYWVPEEHIPADQRHWHIGFSDVTSVTNARTVLCSLLPPVATNHKLPLISAEKNQIALVACMSSFVFDYVARQKVGGTSMTYFYVKQFPVPHPNSLTIPASWDNTVPATDWLTRRVCELTYTAWDMAGFARDLGDGGPPFVWDGVRRAVVRAELDAAYFHLYGVGRDDVDYIMDTFPIVRRRDEAEHGEYRTRRLVLENYDAMRRAIDTGEPFRSTLDPPPGHGPRHPAPAG